MNWFPRYRIVRVDYPEDPCHWQLQERVFFFFWRNSCGNVSSATTAAYEMEERMRKQNLISRRAA